MLDGDVITAPVITQAIPNGQAQITGSFTRAQAEDLAAQLQSGALPVDLQVGNVSVFSSSASNQAASNQ